MNKIVHRSLSSFILHPSSFLSMSAQKFLNVCVVGAAQALVSAAEDNLSVLHHQYFAVDETKLFAFLFKDDVAGFVDHGIFRAQIFQIIHFVGDENR